MFTARQLQTGKAIHQVGLVPEVLHQLATELFRGDGVVLGRMLKFKFRLYLEVQQMRTPRRLGSLAILLD